MKYPFWISNRSGDKALAQLFQGCDSALLRSSAPLPTGVDLASPAEESIVSPATATSAYSPAPLPPIEWPTQQPEFRAAPAQAAEPHEYGVGPLRASAEAVRVDPLRPYGHRRY
jgi:hypothetical protein